MHRTLAQKPFAELVIRVNVEFSEEGCEDLGVVLTCVRQRLGLKRSPRAWGMHSTEKLNREQLNLTSSRSDGCVFFNSTDDRKPGRHVEGFLIRGACDIVDMQLETMAAVMGL